MDIIMLLNIVLVILVVIIIALAAAYFFIVYRNKNVQTYGFSKMGHRIGHKGVQLGNVYTAFSRYYADLGLIGVMFFPICLGALLMKFLSLIFNYTICFCKRHIFFIMLYAFFYNQLVVFAADDTFFTYFRPGNLEVPILFYFINVFWEIWNREIIFLQ